MRTSQVPTPRTGTGWLWLAAAALAAWTFLFNGGDTRTEFSDGFSSAYCESDRPFGQTGPRPGCDTGPAGNTTDPLDEVAQP